MHEPLHATVAATLEGSIRSGEWPPDSRLPTERDLTRRFGVSRSTVRQALADLEQRGLVTRRQGRGTHVAPVRLEADVTTALSLSAAIRSRGLRLATDVLGVKTMDASRPIARDLGLMPGEAVVRIRRLRTVGDEPLILETAFLPASLFPGLAAADLATRSLYDILREDFDRPVAAATETIEPVILTPRESGRLGVAPNAPALLVRRITTDRLGVRIESAQALLRGDRARFLLELRVDDLDIGRPPAVRTELLVGAPAR